MGLKKYAYINNNILKWAREQTPLEIDDIAELSKTISVENIEKWENGEAFPTINEAKKLANIYDIPFSAFYLPNPPNKDNTTVIDRRTYLNDVNVKISYDLWKEINKLKSYRENALEYLEEDKYNNFLNSINVFENENNISNIVREMFDIKTPFKNKSSYNNNAFKLFRKKIENKGIMVFQIEGISIKQVRGLSLNYSTLPIIAVNKKDSDRAKVFTLFHELAHLIRRTSNICLIDFDENADDEEKKCNSLAAEILVPGDSIKKEIKEIDINDDVNIDKLSDKYAVSKFVIIKRLYDLNIISYLEYNNKYNVYLTKFNEILHLTNKKVFVSPDKKFVGTVGNLYPKILLDAYYNEKISYGELCNTFNINAKHVEGIEKAVMSGE